MFFETDQDRETERQVLSDLAVSFGCDFYQTERRGETFDGELFDEHRRLAFVEVKDRPKMTWGEYDTVIIDEAKARELRDLRDCYGFPVLIAVRANMPDGGKEIRVFRVGKNFHGFRIDCSGGVQPLKGGGSVRKPVIHLPVSMFHLPGKGK